MTVEMFPIDGKDGGHDGRTTAVQSFGLAPNEPTPEERITVL